MIPSKHTNAINSLGHTHYLPSEPALCTPVVYVSSPEHHASELSSEITFCVCL
jgi:hypothetical protein